VRPSRDLTDLDGGARVEVAGVVLVRQRPGTAKGVIFVTVEDETGVANIIVRPPVFERFRRVVLGARLISVRGRVEREGIVIHVMAEELLDRSDRLRLLSATEAVPGPAGRGDQVRHQGRDPRDALPKGRSFR
jgi:error-prone DNA polymerase